MEKVKVSQDVLYQYLTEHNVNITGMAREIKVSATALVACFLRRDNRHGNPRCLMGKTLLLMNEHLTDFSQKIRQSLISFGSEQTFTNKHGNTYDPAALESIRQLSEFFNLTAFLMRVLGWNRSKKNVTFSSPTSKFYGHISEDDVNRINAELLAVANVLSSYEVVPDAVVV
ncbi:MAG: hypothetical protein II844_05005 [Prevotella sp.]|nr:hypothetical protein [Prevotella sp.]